MPPSTERIWRRASKLAGRRLLVGGSALGRHEHRPPSAQTVIDACGEDWLSRFPEEVGVSAGESPTFDDPRLRWGIQKLEVAGASVLELGSLEAGHTYMLDRAGAARVIAIESNRDAFLRGLATREVVGLESARFMCGDFLEYLRDGTEVFDVCVASGVLYHLLDPAELIELLAKRARRLFLWTHYVDEQLLAGSKRFGAPRNHATGGFEHRLHPRPYSRIGLRIASFPGGMNRAASWLTRADLLGALEFFGWGDVEIGPETRGDDGAPALSLVARNRAL